jgi:hypothetical protein
MKPARVSQVQLERWVWEWQTVLSLQDWLVEIEYIRGHETEDSYWEGRCHIAIKLKRAKIELLDPVDHLPVPRFPYDTEETIVHELLHLHFTSFQTNDWDSPTGVAQEQAIELIARGLIDMKRRHEAMAKKMKGKAVVPGMGGKPKGMKMPEGGGEKMVKGKAKGGKGKGKMCG